MTAIELASNIHHDVRSMFPDAEFNWEISQAVPYGMYYWRITMPYRNDIIHTGSVYDCLSKNAEFNITDEVDENVYEMIENDIFTIIWSRMELIFSNALVEKSGRSGH